MFSYKLEVLFIVHPFAYGWILLDDVVGAAVVVTAGGGGVAPDPHRLTVFTPYNYLCSI